MYRLISAAGRAITASGQKLTSGGGTCCYRQLFNCSTLAASPYYIIAAGAPGTGVYFSIPSTGLTTHYIIDTTLLPCPLVGGTLITTADLLRQDCCVGCFQCNCECICDHITNIQVTIAGTTPYKPVGGCENERAVGIISFDYIINLFNIDGPYILTPVTGQSCKWQANISGALSVTKYGTGNKSCGPTAHVYDILNMQVVLGVSPRFTASLVDGSGAGFAGAQELSGNIDSHFCMFGQIVSNSTGGSVLSAGGTTEFELP